MLSYQSPRITSVCRHLNPAGIRPPVSAASLVAVRSARTDRHRVNLMSAQRAAGAGRPAPGQIRTRAGTASGRTCSARWSRYRSSMSRSSAAASLRLSSGDGRARIRQVYRQLASGGLAVRRLTGQAAGLAPPGDRHPRRDAKPADDAFPHERRAPIARAVRGSANTTSVASVAR